MSEKTYRIKKLKWLEDLSDNKLESYIGRIKFTIYDSMFKDGWNYDMCYDIFRLGGSASTLDEAKDKCQKLFEEHIERALEEV